MGWRLGDINKEFKLNTEIRYEIEKLGLRDTLGDEKEGKVGEKGTLALIWAMAETRLKESLKEIYAGPR